MEPTQTTTNLVLYVIIAIVIGFTAGFYINSARVSKLERQLDPYLRREAEVKQAEEGVVKSIEQNKLTSSQIKKAEQDVIKSLTPR
ncbi:MAG: hypothetical protein UW81_C0027G0001 [Candidatus Giovannonibacteria bacterium GW2011_GWC2_44_9]|uniref:Uncharacterized protein n=2 Tax=Candidatus Giovannoniibacteriota TaxID=1752738 RepID=A0A0G1KZY1_9BACT|nr:MAG: hypothetical protein UW57_C0026G0001 [Candidatus Giovannonibacteria bacterium GW2011_GWA1_44_29]KKT83058.1 MAG: hypothetical protein UW81_C0027G0001 [Candidatus Giovannonibacteria bacterium GW2011_GWC2_44_9]KKT90759.1 MAG: hypothetical protein UW93_C0022G0007 [Parcubacteria group bacterium GW2011_GWC1_45_13]HBB53967.1 hypothetical protein [Candidatus Nomurabacteria bacterium]